MQIPCWLPTPGSNDLHLNGTRKYKAEVILEATKTKLTHKSIAAGQCYMVVVLYPRTN